MKELLKDREIVLEDNNVYVIVKTIELNNYTYAYVINKNNKIEGKFIKIILKGNEQYIIQINNIKEIEQILNNMAE